MNNKMENYSNVGGCGVLHPFNRSKRAACEESHLSKISVKEKADQDLAQAALAQAQREDTSWSPLAVTGVLVASLLGIALMVVIIKKAKK